MLKFISNLKKKDKKRLTRILISFLFYIPIYLCQYNNIFINLILNLIPYFIVGYDVIIKSFKALFAKRLLNESFLMTIATFGAIILTLYKQIKYNDTPDYQEAYLVMTLYQVGELFQSVAINKSRKNISDLINIQPQFANRIKDDNQIEVIRPSQIEINDKLLVKLGELVPIDSKILKGITTLDTQSLTGESMPVCVCENDIIYAGSINTGQNITIEAIKLYKDSSVSKIFELIENASNSKSKKEKFITSFAKVYTPIVCVLSILTTLIPVVLNYVFNFNLSIEQWVFRSLMFLIISCPCALIISIPLAYFASIGLLSKYQILIKGSNYIETLTKVKAFVFDKTGTLTTGKFSIIDYKLNKNKDEVIRKIAHLQYLSNHPIASSILNKYDGEIDQSIVKDFKEIIAKGVTGYVNEEFIICGNKKLFDDFSIKIDEIENNNNVIYIAINNNYIGYITIADTLKQNSKKLIKKLHQKTYMLTGDNKQAALSISNKLEIDKCYYKLLPHEKLDYLKQIKDEHKIVCYVGDGINDAACLSYADVGISMGKLGSSVSIESSDIVIMDDDPYKIIKAIEICNKTMSIIKFNIAFSLIIKIGFMLLLYVNITNMIMAIFADLGVTILAILNSIRLLYLYGNRYKK